MQLEFIDVIAVVAAVVAAASAVASMVSAIASWKQVRLMREELEKKERPYIFGHFQEVRHGIIGFVLENKGSVAAVNVEAHFEEPAPTLHDGASLNTMSVFSNTIAFFPPGENYSVPIGPGRKLLAEGMQTKFKLILSYQTPAGRIIPDSIAFDLSYLRSVLSSPATTAEMLKELKFPLDRISSVMDGWRTQQWIARMTEELELKEGTADEGSEG